MLPRIILILTIIYMTTPDITYSQLTGVDIMTKADSRDDGTERRSESTMRLINKKGKERVRKVLRLEKEYGEDTKAIIMFMEPADVRGTGLLMFDYSEADKDDDQWLYLPALKRVRRIAASKKSDNFMGTDLTYEDMGDREVEDDEHVLKGEETVSEYDCYIIESVPIKKSGYSRRVSWIIKDLWLPLKVDFYDRHGALLKQMTLSNYEEIDGIWTNGKIEMHNVQNNHRTVIEIENVAYNSGLDDKLFTERQLKKGRLE